MEKNIIFCFSGTGNSLKVAKDIAGHISNCAIVNMKSNNKNIDVRDYKRIGFVFPVYFLGMPWQVEQRIASLEIPANFNGYFFAVSTYANIPGNSIRDIDRALKQQKQSLQYGSSIKMADNAIAYYQTHSNLEKLTKAYPEAITRIVSAVAASHIKKIRKSISAVHSYHRLQIQQAANRDVNFHVGEGCIGCGICMGVCPADNITIENKRPEFHHKCEQCMACIQLCPIKAIDYKGKCGQRLRYRHPEITIKEMKRLNKA